VERTQALIIIRADSPDMNGTAIMQVEGAFEASNILWKPR
jgi:hypothetical protein